MSCYFRNSRSTNEISAERYFTACLTGGSCRGWLNSGAWLRWLCKSATKPTAEGVTIFWCCSTHFTYFILIMHSACWTWSAGCLLQRTWCHHVEWWSEIDNQVSTPFGIPVTSLFMKQLTWLRTIHSSEDWCLRLEHSRNDGYDECYFGRVKLCECACAKNVRLDDEAVLENVSVTEPAELTTTSLTGTQQALLLALWSVILLSQSYHKSLLSK